MVSFNFKKYLSWGIAFFFFVCEIIIHSKCGFDIEEDEEEECLGIPGWGALPPYTEAICQSTMAVVVVGMMFDAFAAMKKNDLGGYLREQFISDNKAASIVALCAACWTAAIGLFCVLGFGDEDDLPKWMAVWSHLFETGCETIVVVCVVGLFCDFCAAVAAGKALDFVMGFIMCTDDLEEHGGLTIEDAHGGDAHGLPHDEHGGPESDTSLPRVITMWIVFGSVAFAVYCRETSDEEEEESLIYKPLELFGVFCASGITMAIVLGVVNLEKTMERVVSGKSPGSMLKTGENKSERVRKSVRMSVPGSNTMGVQLTSQRTLKRDVDMTASTSC